MSMRCNGWGFDSREYWGASSGDRTNLFMRFGRRKAVYHALS